MGLRDVRIGVCVCAHNERDYIEYCLRSIYDFAHVIAVSVNVGAPWGTTSIAPLDDTLEIVRSFPDPDGKLHVISGEWGSEMDQRIETFDMLRSEANYVMTVDADEVYTREHLNNIRRFVTLRPWVGQFRIHMKTYWKIHPFYVIDPPEPYRRYLITKLRPSTRLMGFSRTNEPWRCTIPQRVAVFHHFSYARPDERIRRKLAFSSHRDDLVPNWYENVWLKWDEDHSLENLHPMHPAEYKRAIPVDPEMLPEVIREHPFAGIHCQSQKRG